MVAAFGFVAIVHAHDAYSNIVILRYDNVDAAPAAAAADDDDDGGGDDDDDAGGGGGDDDGDDGGADNDYDDYMSTYGYYYHCISLYHAYCSRKKIPRWWLQSKKTLAGQIISLESSTVLSGSIHAFWRTEISTLRRSELKG